ncbi:uncharacterized protein LOC122243527, partial [Penaeus japonicus]|uniref:uncharacterized protein LOC122243527 n=1 Tax=Penaeus japonicus TaxID=27405 RepID=UPI001C70CD72
VSWMRRKDELLELLTWDSHTYANDDSYAHTIPQAMPIQYLKLCPYNTSSYAHTIPQAMPIQYLKLCPYNTSSYAYTILQAMPIQYLKLCPYSTSSYAHTVPQAMPIQYLKLCPYNTSIRIVLSGARGRRQMAQVEAGGARRPRGGPGPVPVPGGHAAAHGTHRHTQRYRAPRPRGGRARDEGDGEALQQRQHDRAQVRDRESPFPPRRRHLAEGRHAALLQHLQRRHQVSPFPPPASPGGGTPRCSPSTPPEAASGESFSPAGVTWRRDATLLSFNTSRGGIR